MCAVSWFAEIVSNVAICLKDACRYKLTVTARVLRIVPVYYSTGSNIKTDYTWILPARTRQRFFVKPFSEAGVHVIIYKNSVRTSSKTHCAPTTDTDWFVLSDEIRAAFCENPTLYCVIIAGVSVPPILAVHVVTIGLYRVRQM
jgi:hypothetical protein